MKQYYLGGRLYTICGRQAAPLAGVNGRLWSGESPARQEGEQDLPPPSLWYDPHQQGRSDRKLSDRAASATSAPYERFPYPQEERQANQARGRS